MSRAIAPLLLGIFLAPLFAFADSPTVTITSLSPGSGVVTGTSVTFTATSTGLTNPTYSVRDSFANSSVSFSSMGSGGSFNWTPVFTDIGTHTITVTATDASGNLSASASQDINVSLMANVSISGITPGTSIDPGQNLKFNAVPVGFASTTSYTLSDSFVGSTVSSSNINSSGNFSWTPAGKDAGSHKITVNVSDSEGRSASGSLTITVGGSTGNSTSASTSASGVPATMILTAPVPDASIPVGSAVTFSALAYGFSNPIFSVSDAFNGTSISKSNINSSGNFSWTPASRDMGTHNLTVTASDTAGHSAIASAQITVTAAIPGASPSVVSSIPVFPPVVPALAGATFTTYLRLGMNSEEVRALQNVLAREGFFSGSATGYFGPMTESAVKNFQRARGLEALGVVGVQTRAALNSLSGETTSPVSVVGNIGTNIGRISALEIKIAYIQAQLLLIQQELKSVLEELARLKAGQ